MRRVVAARATVLFIIEKCELKTLDKAEGIGKEYTGATPFPSDSLIELRSPMPRAISPLHARLD